MTLVEANATAQSGLGTTAGADAAPAASRVTPGAVAVAAGDAAVAMAPDYPRCTSNASAGRVFDRYAACMAVERSILAAGMKNSLVVGFTLAYLLPVAAAAQGVGFQAGAAFDPEQIYLGSHVEFPIGSNQFVIRPGIEGAFGGGWRIAAIRGDFIYRVTLGASGWRIRQGLGPSVNITRSESLDLTDVSAGWNYLMGVDHENGFFIEFKGGPAHEALVPLVWIGVGFTIRP